MAEKPAGDRQPQLPNPEEQERLLERFVAELETYRTRIDGYAAFSEKNLLAGLQRPPGLRHDPGLYRSQDGTFWKITTGDFQGKRQGVLIEYVRPAGGKFGKYEAVMSPYRPMDDVKTMESSLHAVDKDWAWEEMSESDRAQGRKDTVATSRADLDRDRFAQMVISELLRQKEGIKQWLREYALESDRLHYTESGDLDAFYSRFLPALQSVKDEYGERKEAPNRKDLPDPAPIHAMLHGTLNALAGHPESRSYLY